MTTKEPLKEEEKPSCEKGCCGTGSGNDVSLAKTETESAPPPTLVESSCCSSGGCSASDKIKTTPSTSTSTCCTNDHTHEDHEDQHHHYDDSDSPLCLAVIREDGGDVVLFDASGRPRSFDFKGDIRNLCFDTHGITGSFVDDLLTPCLDEDGNHGLPEESCFCGVDTPHLHAHLRDPRTCNDNDGNEKPSGKSSKMEDKLSYLASQTLHPLDMDMDKDNNTTKALEAEKGIPLFNLDVSENLPKACNPKEESHEHEHEHEHDKDNCDHESHKLKNPLRRRRMHKVRHDDHDDYLVHNPTTGELHLEHPSCNDCGQDDVHGRFRSVGKRKLQREGKGVSGSTGSIRIQFFEVAPPRTGPLHTILDAFELTSDRVAAVEHIMQLESTTTPDKSKQKSGPSRPEFWGIPPKAEPAKVSTFITSGNVNVDDKTEKTVRSTLVCSRICCASEIPMINIAMDKLGAGIHKVMINVPLKQVIVDHYPNHISAKEIESALNKNHLGASVKRDGGAGMAAPTSATVTKGRSHFFVQHICCASEIPAINSIVEPIKGVSAVSINVTTKMVYVDHDTGFVSAQDVCDALNQQGFGAQVRHDFSAAAASAQSMFVRSTLTFEQQQDAVDPDTQALTVFLRTFDASQLESFLVDVPAKTITVVHNPLGLSAQTIAVQLLEPTGIKASVLLDGADGKLWDIPAVSGDASLDGMEGDEPMTYPSPAVVLSGVFWLVSMLSFIPGDW